MAQAGTDDPYNIVAGASVRYESNLFRVQNEGQLEASGLNKGMSDWIYSETLGIKIDKPYSLQRFQLDLTGTHNHNQTYSFLDADLVNYRAAWLWAITPDWTGELSASQNQAITNFSQYRGTQTSINIAKRNISTSESRVFKFDGDIGAGIHLVGGASELRSRTSQNFAAIGDYVQDGIEFGVKYVAPSQNSITVVRREANGDYNRPINTFSLLDTGFDQHETEVKVNWRVTGKSEVDARLDYLEREFDHFSQRDYSGVTGNITYVWYPTGKLVLNTTLSRNLYTFQEAFNSFYSANTLTIAPTWLFSEKTTFRLRYDYSEQDFHGAIILPPKMREDRVQTLMLTADWKATRNILVTGVAQHEKRSSNIDGLDYNSNSIGITAQLLFWP